MSLPHPVGQQCRYTTRLMSRRTSSRTTAPMNATTIDTNQAAVSSPNQGADKVSTYHGADDANDDIDNETKPATLDDLTGQETS